MAHTVKISFADIVLVPGQRQGDCCLPVLRAFGITENYLHRLYPLYEQSRLLCSAGSFRLLPSRGSRGGGTGSPDSSGNGYIRVSVPAPGDNPGFEKV